MAEGWRSIAGGMAVIRFEDGSPYYRPEMGEPARSEKRLGVTTPILVSIWQPVG
jgi:hypothetical protein